MKRVTYENFTLAKICNDLENVEHYDVDIYGNCYYRGLKIGLLKFKTIDNYSYIPSKLPNVKIFS